MATSALVKFQQAKASGVKSATDKPGGYVAPKVVQPAQQPTTTASPDYSTLIKNAITSNADQGTINNLLTQRQTKIDTNGLAGKVESNDDLLKALNYNPTPTKQVEQPAVQTVTPPVQPIQKAVDNSGLINQQHDNLVSALKAQIQKSINNKQQQIDQLPQQYQPMKNESEVRKFNELRTVLEQSANAGDRGGVGRQNALETQVAGENRLNDINLQQETAKNTLTNDIENLNLEQTSKTADIEAQRLRDLISNNTTVDETNYSRTQDAINRQEKNTEIERKNYIDSITGLGNQFDYEAEITKIQNDGDRTNDWKIPYLQQERERKIENNLQNDIKTIDRYSNDYQAEIDRRKAINPNDPLIPYLHVARQQKIAAQKAAEQSALKELYTRYMDLFKQTGVVSGDEMAMILGVPKGTYSLDYAKTVYETNKPYYSPYRGGGSSGSTTTTGSNSKAYNEVDGRVSALIKSFEADPNIYVPNGHYDSEKNVWVKDDGVKQDWIRTKGSEQYNTIFSMIMNSNLSDDDKEYLLQKNRIPY